MVASSAETRLFFFPEVEARLWSPAVSEDGKESVSHFIRSFYVWAHDEKGAMAYIVQYHTAEDVELLGCAPSLSRSEHEVPADLRQQVVRDRSGGIAWRSGRVFFQPD